MKALREKLEMSIPHAKARRLRRAPGAGSLKPGVMAGMLSTRDQVELEWEQAGSENVRGSAGCPLWLCHAVYNISKSWREGRRIFHREGNWLREIIFSLQFRNRTSI